MNNRRKVVTEKHKTKVKKKFYNSKSDKVELLKYFFLTFKASIEVYE